MTDGLIKLRYHLYMATYNDQLKEKVTRKFHILRLTFIFYNRYVIEVYPNPQSEKEIQDNTLYIPNACKSVIVLF